MSDLRTLNPTDLLAAGWVRSGGDFRRVIGPYEVDLFRPLGAAWRVMIGLTGTTQYLTVSIRSPEQLESLVAGLGGSQ